MSRKPVLADTSIWVDHIAGKETALADLLRERRVALHPMVIGEIAMGSLRQRKILLEELNQLPAVIVASNAEVMVIVERRRLYNEGIGFIDAHLLAATLLTKDALLLTKDGRLRAQAERLGVVYTP